ncbi:MAG: hypothetical protein KFF77_00805 [Bacteroidetes bacterium]|nr:hypothetical protein [Bacteroidota bacterium]
MSGIFEHNIRLSLQVIGGGFETALEDIIRQLESPPEHDGRRLTAWEMTREIAEAMGEGFAGLPPNGFDFGCWLWETAPLHVVTIPHANSIGTGHGYRYGVVHLRKIAAKLVGTYVQQQPQKAQNAVELIDMSLDWVDARNLTTYALVDFYDAHLETAEHELLALTAAQRSWRRLIPIGVAARRIGMRIRSSAPAFRILQQSVAHVDDPHVYQALRYAFRISGMYGDQHELITFLTTLQRDGGGKAASLLCEFLRNPRLRWEGSSREEMLQLLRHWRSSEQSDTGIRCIDEAIARLQIATD